MADKKIEKKRMKMISQLETLSGKFFRYQREGKTDKLKAVEAEATALRAALLAFDEVYPPEEDYKYGRLIAIYVPFPKKFHPEEYMTEEEKRAQKRDAALERKDIANESNLKSIADAIAEIFVHAFFGYKWKTEPTGESGTLAAQFYVDDNVLRFYSNDRISTNDRIIKLRDHNIYACTNAEEHDVFLDHLKPHLKTASKEAFDKKFAELAKTITFKTEIVDAQYTDFVKRESPKYACLQMNLNYTYPAPPPKPVEPPKPVTPVQAPTSPAVQKSAPQAPSRPAVSADTGPIPIINSNVLKTAASSSSTTNTTASFANSGLPKIPGGNRYAGHDELINRIAKDIVDGIFEAIKPVQWYQVPSQQWVFSCRIDVKVERDNIYVSSSRGYSKNINFVKYNRRAIPDVNMFVFAINPFIEYYAKQRAEETFGRVHFLSKYKLKVTLEKYTYSIGSEKVVYRSHIELDQYLLPSKSLNSW